MLDTIRYMLMINILINLNQCELGSDITSACFTSLLYFCGHIVTYNIRLNISYSVTENAKNLD